MKWKGYWSNIASVDSYYRTNMDFLKKDIRDYFFKQYPDVYSKVDDLPPAKYNPGAVMRNSLIASGCIINGTVENSILFKKVYVGNNCTIKNSIILNDVHIGDNTYIENCIVESKGTIRANSTHVGENGQIKIVIEEKRPLFYMKMGILLRKFSKMYYGEAYFYKNVLKSLTN